MLKDNHVYNFAQKNARYRYSYYGATTDNNIKDNSIITALMRGFSDEIKNGTTNVFTCRIDKSLKKKRSLP